MASMEVAGGPCQPCRGVAAELIAGLERVYRRSKGADQELTELLAATGTTLMDLHGIGPSARHGC